MDQTDDPATEVDTVDTVIGWYDPATRLLGPEAWSLILATESSRCKRYGRAATVVIVEVTGIDELSATWGADVGQVAVANIGAVLRSRARKSDYVARIGARRFASLLPETDEVAAVNFVERARDACDKALQVADSTARTTFGWADATKTRTLLEAVPAAMARLATDRPAGEGA
jgi:diguanylate cyclase (GGDEF)-like protein